MAATVAGRVIDLDAAAESTADIFTKTLVSAIKLVTGGTTGATVISANGVDIYTATPAINTVEDIGPQGAPVLYDSIVATTLPTGVVCHVHFL